MPANIVACHIGARSAVHCAPVLCTVCRHKPRHTELPELATAAAAAGGGVHVCVCVCGGGVVCRILEI